MLKRAIPLLGALLVACSAIAQDYSGKVLVLPLEAVVDSARLSHGEFKKLYPGIDISNFGLTDEGWYIRYSHESLVYLFGPTEDLDRTREYKAILDSVRLSAVLKNPKLSSSKIEIIRFDFADNPNAVSPENNPYLIPEKR